MKKLLILLTVLLLILVSCEPFFPKHWYLKITLKGNDCPDLYYSLNRDTFSRYPTEDICIYDIEPGEEYILRLYIVTETSIEDGVEKRIIDDTYETHFTIDHWETTLSVTYTKEEGLGCSIRKEGNID